MNPLLKQRVVEVEVVYKYWLGLDTNKNTRTTYVMFELERSHKPSRTMGSQSSPQEQR